MLAEIINSEIKKRSDSTSIPNLPIVDTQEILEKIGTDWKIPKPFGKHTYNIDLFKDHEEKQFQDYCDRIFTSWINYCNRALEGKKTVDRVRKNGIISGDKTNVESYIFFQQALPDEADISKAITSIHDAFSTLLSDETRERLGLEKITEKPTQETREKIDTLLVRFMKFIPPVDFCKTK